jgi:hypothetical protein
VTPFELRAERSNTVRAERSNTVRAERSNTVRAERNNTVRAELVEACAKGSFDKLRVNGSCAVGLRYLIPQGERILGQPAARLVVRAERRGAIGGARGNERIAPVDRIELVPDAANGLLATTSDHLLGLA